MNLSSSWATWVKSIAKTTYQLPNTKLVSGDVRTAVKYDDKIGAMSIYKNRIMKKSAVILLAFLLFHSMGMCQVGRNRMLSFELGIGGIQSFDKLFLTRWVQG